MTRRPICPPHALALSAPLGHPTCAAGGPRRWLRRLKQMLCTALLLAAGGLAMGAEVVDPARLDRWLTDLDRQRMAMGSLAVLRDGEPPLLRAVGASRVAAPAEAATPATRYRIGSISKTMTAVMVMQLVEEGRVSLDDPVARWFPDLPEATRMTVAQLLGHRSGIGDIKDLPDFEERWARQARSEAELVRAITSLPRAFAPGARLAYNNSGYLLLSFIVEKAGGQPYQVALASRIAQRAGLRATGFDGASPLQAGEALSYRWSAERQGWDLAQSTHPSVPQGAGGVVSTPEDLVRFIRALFDGQLVKPATLARMLQAVDGMGLGLYRLEGPGGTAWGHEGLIDGFASTLLWHPERRMAVAWCGNAYQLPRDALVQALRQAVFEPGARLPSYAPTPATVDFAVEFPTTPGRPAPTAMSLRGDAPPLSWQRSLPLRFDATRQRWQARVTLTVRDGLPIQFKYLVGDEGWERTDNRLLTPNPERVTTTDDVFNHDAARLALRREILAADEALFDGMARGDVGTFARGFSPRLEFFHDRTGLTGYEANLEQLRANFARPQRVKRERVAGEQEVFEVPGFGAMHIGAHRFCPEGAPPDRCGVFRFTHVWERTPEGWRLLRVISLDH